MRIRFGFALAAAMVIAAPVQAATTIVVMPTPGNPVQSGNDLLAAVAGITNNDWSHRYVVKLDPGVYDLGIQTLVMKQFVDIAGSGRETTLVYGTGNTDTQGLARGLIEGANNAELRDLTVQVFPADGRQWLVGMFNPGVSPRVSNVQFLAFGSTKYCSALFGIGSSSILEDLYIRVACEEFAEGMSFDLAPGRPLILRADIIAKNVETTGYAAGLALYLGGAPSEIRDSRIVGTGGATAVGLDLVNTNQTVTTTITNTTISGQIAAQSFGVRSSSELGLLLRHSRISAHSGTTNIGIDKTALAFLNAENSIVIGSTNTARSIASPPIQIGGSKLQGGPTSGPVTCAGNYDETFSFFISTCPP